MKSCPTCGHPLPTDQVLPGLHLSPRQTRIFNIVSRRTPAGISVWDLISLVYADDPDGGSECADITMRTQIYFINRKLESYGLRIKGGGGYRLMKAA